jgi:Helix-turn-helix domain
VSALCLGPCRAAEYGGPRQAGRGGRLCDVCADHLKEHLQQIADAWPDLIERLATEGSSAMSEKVRGSKSPGLVLNERVSDGMREVAGWLLFVARLVCDERQMHAPQDQDPASLAEWLSKWHSSWLATHHDEQLVADMTREADAHAHTCRRLAYPNGTRTFAVGPCTEHMTGEDGSRLPCTGTMTAILRDSDSLLPSELRCDGPEPHSIPPRLWMGVGDRLWSTRLTIKDAARITGVSAGTIRRWVSEGRITGTEKPHTVSPREIVDLRDTLTASA